MPLKTVTELVGGKGKRQHIWEAIRRLAAADQAFTESDVLKALPSRVRNDTEAGAVREYRVALVNAGILVCVTAPGDAGVKGTYRLAINEGLEAPRLRKDGSRVTTGLAQEQMWRTLRMLTTDINGRELAAHASTPAIPVAEIAARDYLRTLNTAGYLICTREGGGKGKGGSQARYRLNPGRNTGPRPPMVCRTRVVYDPNEGKVVWQPSVTDEDAIYG